MKRVWYVVVPLFILVGAVGVLYSQLQPALPKPTGPNIVGYQRFAVEQGERWVDLQIFYPATAKTDQQPQAIPVELAQEFGKAYNAPTIAMQDERALPAYTDAPVANGQHPILVFNHGHGMYATQNSHQIIELASHGYIVIALNHPRHSLLSKNGTQTVLRGPDIADYEDDEIKTLLLRQQRGNNELRAANSLNEWNVAMSAIQQEAFADIVDQFPKWIENNSLVLNALPKLQTGEIENALAGKMDLDKIGYFGHSFGGAVATHMGMNDERIKAAFNLDGPVFTWSLKESPTANFCFAYADSNNQAGIPSDFSWANRQIAIATHGCERTFKGASHMNFSDLNEIKMMKWLGQLGPIDNIAMREHLNASLLQFFNLHLRGTGEIAKLAGTELIQH
ncbi:chlorophyllase/cutinase-like alpha/beta fold protein [Maritalea porphyrae]|uniref:alpha/beta hydrolase n=1 Tax=Maritalea porphyrae TaxID=880732 RepID=UPI0022AE566A|nr:hypothetical protein [Maritalea porphyrae]MCZ4272681.1 hypothetical protein [Maritalea porphyrae]